MGKRTPLINIKMKNITCPVCRSTKEKEVLGNYTSEMAASYFCPVSRNADRNERLRKSIETLWNSDKATILACKECDFGFGFPFVGGDETFYSILHEQKGYPGWKWDYNYAINNVFNKEKPQKVLDIGAGEGLFLKRLDRNIQKYASEGSEDTRIILEDAGINVFRDPAKIADEHYNSFDCITIFQVLEHISQFDQVLAQAYKLLKPNGILIISVPELQSMIDQEKYTGCPDMIPNHINKFSAKSLTMAIQHAGLRVQHVVHEPSYFLKIFNSLHLYLINRATQEGTLANRVYSIKNKKVRTAFLSILAIPALLKLLPNIGKLSKGGSILAIGYK